MEIKLVSTIPLEDGYFLMKLNPTGGIHLVLIQTQLDGGRVIMPDTYTKKQIIIEIKKGHDDVLKHALFSEKPFKFV